MTFKPSFWRCFLHQFIGHDWWRVGFYRICSCGAIMHRNGDYLQ